MLVSCHAASVLCPHPVSDLRSGFGHSKCIVSGPISKASHESLLMTRVASLADPAQSLFAAT